MIKQQEARKVEFMEMEPEIEQIEGLSVQAGLESVKGQWDVYKKSLRLTIKEIQKCDINLNKFLAEGDMRSFCIEAHGMKGMLATIGALTLSPLALELETAADRKDAAFCASAMPPFLEALRGFGFRLAEVFAKEDLNRGPVEIPQGLSVIFEKLKAALNESDFSAIDREMLSLDMLNPERALEDEIEKIKDAVMMMDYNSALEVIENLLKH